MLHCVRYAIFLPMKRISICILAKKDAQKAYRYMYLENFCIFTCMFAGGSLRIFPPQQFYRLCINQRISWYDEQYSHLLIFCRSWIRQATNKKWRQCERRFVAEFVRNKWIFGQSRRKHQLTAVTRIEANKMRLECLWETFCYDFHNFLFLHFYTLKKVY